MVKYLLVEDERFAYEELKRMMQRLRPSWQLAGWAESVEQAVLLLRQGSLDLMIVDIRLSDGLSFEIFEQCPVDLPVIFTTARLRRICHQGFQGKQHRLSAETH